MKSTNEVFISICIPTFRRCRVISTAIKSAINQQYDNYEIIVVDNHSNDGTVELVNEFCNPKLSLYVNEKTVSMYENHNIALGKARANWLVVLHSDEELKPNALRDFNKLIISNGEKKIGAISPLMERPSVNILAKERWFKSVIDGVLAKCMIINGIGSPSGVCYNRQAMLDVGSFEGSMETFYYYTDHMSYFNLVTKGYSIIFCSNEVVVFTPSIEQETAKLPYERMVKESIAFSQYVLRDQVSQIFYFFNQNFKSFPIEQQLRIVRTFLLAYKRNYAIVLFFKISAQKLTCRNRAQFWFILILGAKSYKYIITLFKSSNSSWYMSHEVSK